MKAYDVVTSYVVMRTRTVQASSPEEALLQALDGRPADHEQQAPTDVGVYEHAPGADLTDRREVTPRGAWVVWTAAYLRENVPDGPAGNPYTHVCVKGGGAPILPVALCRACRWDAEVTAGGAT